LLKRELPDHRIDPLLDRRTVRNRALCLKLGRQEGKNATKKGYCDVKRLITHVVTPKTRPPDSQSSLFL
jgi:hypothetical protein